MPEKLQTRVVDTGGAASNTIVNRRPTCVHWITVSAQVLATQGMIQIYDGSDAGGELVWQLKPGYSRHHNFIPHICCQVGCFIYTNAHIASFSVGYTPLSEAPFKESEGD